MASLPTAPAEPGSARPRHDPCTACGGAFPEGRQGCEAEFNVLNGAAQLDPLKALKHRLVVDTYCLQHLDPYCLSARSFAAHLVGLCWGMEHGGGNNGYVAIQRWLNGSLLLEKPAPPSVLGVVTLADVVVVPPGVQREEHVAKWAQSVWKAYESHHGIAQDWLAEALSAPRPNARQR